MMRRHSVKRRPRAAQAGAARNASGSVAALVDPVTHTATNFTVLDAGLTMGLNEIEVATIVSALILGVAITVMASFTFDDFAAADRRLLQHKANDELFQFTNSCYLHPQYDEIAIENFTSNRLYATLEFCGPDLNFLYKLFGPNYPVSGGFAFCGGLSAMFTFLSLMGMAIARVTAPYLEFMQHSESATSLLVSILNPMISACFIMMLAGALLVVPELFYVGWLTYPPHIADSWSWVMTGGLPMCILLLMVIVAFVVKRKINEKLKRDEHLLEESEEGVTIFEQGSIDNDNDNGLDTTAFG